MVRVAFLGSHPLGVECLELLAAHPEVTIELVVTYPRDADRWWEGSVHERALELDLPVLILCDEDRILDHPIEYILSVYYPNILGPEILSHPGEAAINLHLAELPRYRGSNVFSHSIMNAREDDYWRHGTTMHFMAEEVDAGAVIERRFVEITEDDTARDLYDRVREASLSMFSDVLPHIVSGDVIDMGTPQSAFEGPRYFYAKDSLDDLKEIPVDALADPDAELSIYDRIRGLDFPPFEPAYVRLDGRQIYLRKNDPGMGCRQG